MAQHYADSDGLDANSCRLMQIKIVARIIRVH